MTVSLALIPRDAVPRVAELVAPLLTDVHPRTFSVERELQDAAAGDVHLWLVWDGEAKEALAVFCIRFGETVRGEIMGMITYCSGRERERWEGLMPEVKAWAKALGASLMRAEVRPGWERSPAFEGWRKTHVILETEL